MEDSTNTSFQMPVMPAYGGNYGGNGGFGFGGDSAWLLLFILLCGGGWDNSAWGCCATSRRKLTPGTRDGDVGFRLALSLK